MADAKVAGHVPATGFFRRAGWLSECNHRPESANGHRFDCARIGRLRGVCHRATPAGAAAGRPAAVMIPQAAAFLAPRHKLGRTAMHPSATGHYRNRKAAISRGRRWMLGALALAAVAGIAPCRTTQAQTPAAVKLYIFDLGQLKSANPQPLLDRGVAVTDMQPFRMNSSSPKAPPSRAPPSRRRLPDNWPKSATSRQTSPS
jgi:hypothetical protein